MITFKPLSKNPGALHPFVEVLASEINVRLQKVLSEQSLSGQRSLPHPDRLERDAAVPTTPARATSRALELRLPALEARERELLATSNIATIGAYSGLEEGLNELCLSHICEYFLAVDPDLREGEVRGLEELAQQLNMTPSFRKFFDYMVSVLREDGVWDVDAGRLVVRRDLRTVSRSDGLRDQLSERFPGFRGTFDMLAHCSRHFRDALSGETPAITVLFPDGRREFLDRKLRSETIEHTNLSVYQALARDFVVQKVENWPVSQNRPLRILEVGGGGGLFTWLLAPDLRGRDVEYTFTDVGTSIVADALEEGYRQGFDFLRYEVLDIAKDSRDQGFEPCSFDIIVGLNVVHATPRLDESLTQLRRLLTPGGTLCLIEYLKAPRWDNLIWGLAEGWWSFSDAYRGAIPLVDLDTWEKALRDQGFARVGSLPTSIPARATSDAGLILAKAPEQSQRWSPIFGQVVKVESRSDRRNLECHERDGATRLS